MLRDVCCLCVVLLVGVSLLFVVSLVDCWLRSTVCYLLSGAVASMFVRCSVFVGCCVLVVVD